MKFCTIKPTYFSSISLALAIIVTSPIALFSLSLTIGVSSVSALTTRLPYKFRKPPNNGSPGTGTAGGSRDDCKVKNPLIRSISPIAEDKTVGGLTASAQPQFWFSTTFNSDCATLEFVLKSDRGLTLYRGPIEMPKDDKPFAVQLPSSVSLEIGQTYRWAILAKNPKNPPIVVNGSIQRVEATEPTGETLLKAKLYAEQGIWHEAASLVQCLLNADPKDPAAQALWNAIVTDAGMGNLIPNP